MTVQPNSRAQAAGPSDPIATLLAEMIGLRLALPGLGAGADVTVLPRADKAEAVDDLFDTLPV